MLLSPGGHQPENGAEAFSMSGERIFDARRHLGVDLAANDGVALQFAQLLREHIFGWARKESLQFAEPADVAREVLENGRSPLSHGDVGRHSYGPIEGLL